MQTTVTTKTALEETFEAFVTMHKCDGCPARAKVRLRVWETWPTYLDLCNHHANRAFSTYPNAAVLEDDRGADDFITY